MDNDEYEQMAAYAAILVSEPNAFKAALSMGVKPGEALIMANEWTKRPEFIELLEEARSSYSEEICVPTKEEIISEMWRRLKSTVSDKDFFNGAKEIAVIAGYVEKPAPAAIINNNNVTQSVMRVPLAANLDEWEKISQTQQANLVGNANTRH